MDLDEFVKHEQRRLKAFKRWWSEKHEEHPGNFPLSIPEDNEGIWWEAFDMFDPEVDCPQIWAETVLERPETDHG